MSTPLSLTIIVSSHLPEVSYRESERKRVERFACELSRHTGIEVPIIQGALTQAPERGFVLLDALGWHEDAIAECGPEQRVHLLPRLVVIDVAQSFIFDLVERERVAAAIVTSSWLYGWPPRGWEAVPREQWKAAGPCGLSKLAARAGGRCTLTSEHYCELISDHHQGMPHLLVDYLRVYADELGIPQ